MKGGVEKPGRTRRLAANFGWLVGGRTMGALMALGATALAARTLGASDYGLVVLIHAAALIIRQLCNVKTADSVIRYGVPLAEEGRIGELKGLVLRFARIDLLAAGTAAVAAALMLVFFADRFNLPATLEAPAAWYVFALLFSITGTASGTLRLLDRFGALSAQLAVGPAIKLIGVLGLLASPLAGDPAYYVLVWMASYLIEHVYSWWRAYHAFTSHYGPVRTVRPALDQREVRGFLFTTYWQSTLDAAPRQAATLLAGTLLGPAGAALFSFARELSEVLSKPVNVLRQVVFPDLARLWRNDMPRFINVTWRTGAVTAAGGLAVVVVSVFAGHALLTALAGAEFGEAAPLLTLLLLGATIELGGASFRPASYVMGKARALLSVQLLATSLYLAGFVLFANLYGLDGVGLASLLAGITSFVGAGYIVQRGCRERLRADRLAPVAGAGSEA